MCDFIFSFLADIKLLEQNIHFSTQDHRYDCNDQSSWKQIFSGVERKMEKRTCLSVIYQSTHSQSCCVVIYLTHFNIFSQKSDTQESTLLISECVLHGGGVWMETDIANLLACLNIFININRFFNTKRPSRQHNLSIPWCSPSCYSLIMQVQTLEWTKKKSTIVQNSNLSNGAKKAKVLEMGSEPWLIFQCRLIN